MLSTRYRVYDRKYVYHSQEIDRGKEKKKRREDNREKMSDGWCTIESDPAVFNEMLERFGVGGATVEELISLDPDSINQLGQFYGLILLFKWKAAPRAANFDPNAPVYFARQIVQNACATQAIINLVLNQSDKITISGALAEFESFTAEMDPTTRGEMIGAADTLRDVHNSFARPSSFSFEDRKAKEDDDVYHFVSFVYKAGAVWELDGLQPAPILASEANDGNWKEVIVQVVQKRIEELSALDTTGAGQGISFSLMAVAEDKIAKLEMDIALLQSDEKPTGLLEAELENLRERRERGLLENRRRRHNYIPCVVELLRALAEKGKLQGIIDEVKAKSAAKKK